MKKTIIAAITLILSTLLTMPAHAETAVKVYVGKSVLSSAALREDRTYVPIRAFAQLAAPKAEVSWDRETRTATVQCEGLELTAKPGERYIAANGRYLWLSGESFIEDGSLMLPVRALSKAFGCQVVWNSGTRQVQVSGEYTPIESGEDFYDEEDLYWLSRIISAEARGECIEGQVAVGDVVLNRMEQEYWPDSVYEVIFDRRNGVQFAPTQSGTIYDEPTESSVIAAKLALDGADVAGESKFFLNEAIATSLWIVDNCQYVTTIGAHSFYM